MTTLKPGPALKRVTLAVHRGRPIVLELHPKHCELRTSGTRTRYPITYESILHLAAKLRADKDRSERQATRKASIMRGKA